MEKLYAPDTLPSLATSLAVTQMSLIGRLCNGAKFDGSTKGLPTAERLIKGDPTDTAVLRFSEHSLLRCLSLSEDTEVMGSLNGRFEKAFEIPFNSRNKWMMSVVKEKEVLANSFNDEKLHYTHPWMLIKGAPDILFPAVSHALNSDGNAVPFSNSDRSRISQLQAQWSSEGQRVIAVCKRSLDDIKLSNDQNEMEEILYNEVQDLTLVGLISIRDPPRPDVAGAVKVIRAAGVRVFMVTGDFKLTAVAIAKQVSYRSSPVALPLSALHRLESSHRNVMIPGMS